MSAQDDETLDRAVNDTAPADTSPRCTTCGLPIEWAGRGRRPKVHPECKAPRPRASDSAPASSKARGGAANVESAVTILEEMYDGLGMLLFALDRALGTQEPGASLLEGQSLVRDVWKDQAAGLLEKDRRLLALDPSLTRSINKMGAKGGRAGFVIAHVSAITPVAVMAYGVVTMKRASAIHEHQEREV